MSDKQAHKDSSFFEKYLAKTTSPQERSAMREGIDPDSFEGEALEGFESLENDAVALAAIKEIQQKVAKKTGLKQERKMIFPIWKTVGIAASVVGFIAAAYFVNDMLVQENEVAKNDTKNPVFVEEQALNTSNNFQEDSSDSMEALSENNLPDEVLEVSVETKEPEEEDFSLSSKQVEQEKKSRQAAPVLEDEFISANVPVETMDADLFDAEESVKPQPTTIGASDDKGAVVNALSSNKETAVSQSIAKTSTETVSSTSVADFATGKSHYNNRNYTDAITFFQKAVNNGEKVNESNYYLAMSYFNLNKNNKALKYFDEVLKSNSALRYNAMWYKAIILEENGDISGAKALLNELANGSSGFRNQASDKLKSFN